MNIDKLIQKSNTLNRLDNSIINFMKKYGEIIERYLLGGYFIWFGLIILFGGSSASSIIAKSIYWIDSSLGVALLGGWEVVIGIGLIFLKLNRIAILLLFLRIPGVILALIYHYQTCFPNNFFEPSIQGQYLLKQLTLVGAALVIGSSIKRKTTIL